jgi:hypothetical protein
MLQAALKLITNKCRWTRLSPRHGDRKGDRLPTNCQPPETITGSFSMVAGKSIGSATNH